MHFNEVNIIHAQHKSNSNWPYSKVPSLTLGFFTLFLVAIFAATCHVNDSEEIHLIHLFPCLNDLKMGASHQAYNLAHLFNQ